MASPRPTLRPYRRPIGGANGSLNVRRGQGMWVQWNRRTDKRSRTMFPLTGKSESVRSYRLWKEVDKVPQSVQIASAVAKRPDISTIPSTTVLLSTI